MSSAGADRALVIRHGTLIDGSVLEAGKLADILVLRRDPLADIRSLAGGRELACVIKDGAVVSLGDGGGEPKPLALG
jgi:imidazolonepropionase-like amidohydrolase